ncbi:MAG: 4Fe-4S binding protein, partial [Clostridia bacterium]|nr:4Fe-4S binding protein [Clostridia bacterium]
APEKYRGRIVFHADKCINCGMCERVCAGGAISTSSVETEEGLLITRRFFLGSCTFCSCCADFCSKKAIELSQDYHMVARDEADLVVEGTYLKKKPAPKPPKPAEPKAGAAEKAEEAPAPAPRGDGKPVSDPNKCIYCTICAKKCPAEALTVDRASKTWALDEDKCIACGNCAEVCPKKCIII